MKKRSTWLLGVCVLAFSVGGALAAEAPTPFPDGNNEAAWPGKGPIRVFGWMVDNRNYFWTQREKDKGAVVFVGDSLTAGWKGEVMKKAFPDLKVANRGIGGDVTRGVLFRLKEDVLDLKPKALVLCIGTNDLSAHADTAGVAENISEIIAQARDADADLPIVLCTIPPRDAATAPTKPGALDDLNKRISEIAEGTENLVLIDLFKLLSNQEGKPKEGLFAEDRLHFAAGAYEVWAQELKVAFEKLGVK